MNSLRLRSLLPPRYLIILGKAVAGSNGIVCLSAYCPEEVINTHCSIIMQHIYIKEWEGVGGHRGRGGIEVPSHRSKDGTFKRQQAGRELNSFHLELAEMCTEFAGTILKDKHIGPSRMVV